MSGNQTCGFGMHGVAGRGRHEMTRGKVKITPVTGQGREGAQKNGGGGSLREQGDFPEKEKFELGSEGVGI